jgi:4-hydroxy-2-oxoheptanedioate aldolase
VTLTPRIKGGERYSREGPFGSPAGDRIRVWARPTKEPVTTNRLKSLWSAGTPAFGAWCSIPSPFSAELLGAEGFDYVCIDCQHGLIDYDSMWPMVQALARTVATPLVRVPSNDAAWVGKALDAGAEGVIVPLVNTGDEAARAVAACRYPPEGVRSFGPVRSGLLLGVDPPTVNRAVLCLVMIETLRALEVADEICATPGLDGVYIGPADLSISMGLTPATMHESHEHADALETIRSACEAHGITAGIHTSGAEHARRYAEAGFRMCTLPSDSVMLRTTARRDLSVARSTNPPTVTG